MRRSEALVPLSHDHQHALDVALRLRRATDADLDAALERLMAFWAAEGAHHFEIEETLLVPALPADDAEWGPAARRMLREHEEVRGRVAALTGDERAGDAVAAARELGELLHGHVRFEEREAFGILEARLAPEQAAALGRVIAEAHG